MELYNDKVHTWIQIETIPLDYQKNVKNFPPVLLEKVITITIKFGGA